MGRSDVSIFWSKSVATMRASLSRDFVVVFIYLTFYANGAAAELLAEGQTVQVACSAAAGG